jgi:aerobic-type carbon monoxide dehydrogenase small subunit (CoxS/CutS family)
VEDTVIRRTVKLEVNGQATEVAVEPRDTLLDVVRHQLGLTGAHAACETGACGACTIVVDGETIRSCLLFAVQAGGCSVTTIEGVAAEASDGSAARVLMDAFRRNHALQCGFCTPGMVLSALELLAALANPDETAVRRALAGNICRCTGYAGIVAAVLDAARTLGPGTPAPFCDRDVVVEHHVPVTEREAEGEGAP